MALGTMGVAVDQTRIVIFAQQCGDRVVVHVHDRAVFALFGHSALLAQLFYIDFASRKRLGQKIFLELCTVYLRAEFLILDIVGAQFVAVAEQSGCAIQVEQDRVGQ
jgi:hypothetical protein